MSSARRILYILGLTAFSALAAPALADPPASPYAPGATLAPACAPGSANCTVRLSTDDVVEGAYPYYTDTRVRTYLDSLDSGYFFSTTSAVYLFSQAQNAVFADATISAATATSLSVSNFSLGSLTGFLKATGGQVATALVDLATDVTGILGIGNGGTGTSTPGTVHGVEYYDGTTLTNGGGLVFTGAKFGIGTTSPGYDLSVGGNIYVGNGSDASSFSLFGTPFVNANAAGPLSIPVGQDILVVGTSTTGSNNVRGGAFTAIYNGPSSATSAQGLNAFAVMGNLASGNLTLTNGGGGVRNRYGAENFSSGFNAVQMSGISAFVTVNGARASSTDAADFHAETPTVASNALITNAYGLWVRGGTISGTITNHYGAYVDDLISGTNRWAFYQAGAGDSNYFAGKVGLGTTSPFAALSVAGSAYVTATTSSGDFVDRSVQGCSGLTQAVVTDASGKLKCGTLTISDARLKDNITPLDSASGLALIDSLRPVAYTWKDPSVYGATTQLQYGFIAQEALQVAPNLVGTTTPTSLTPDYTYFFNYLGVIAPMVKAIQQLDARVGALTQSVQSAAGTFDTLSAGTLVVKGQLCVGGTCLTGSDLEALLDASHVSDPAADAPSPATPDPVAPDDPAPAPDAGSADAAPSADAPSS